MEIYEVLSENNTNNSPFVQFEKWYGEHLATGTVNPSSVSLGTASLGGIVSVRTVLLKDHGYNGFTFFTNYASRKADQIASGKRAALLFYWPGEARQIRIEGTTEKVSSEISTAYHNSRPRESQLSAWASRQSSVIPDRNYLEEQYSCYDTRFKDIPVPRPDFWGGYRIIPDYFEFWQEREYRLHDRISYTIKDGAWIKKRLAP